MSTPTFSEILEIRRANLLACGASVDSLCPSSNINVYPFQLISTVKGLGSSQYISTPSGSTVVTSLSAGTGIALSASTGNVTISNTGITNIIAGANVNVAIINGTAVISATGSGGGGITFDVVLSSIVGLGSTGYISTLSLTSTVQGLLSNTSINLVSSVKGLGSSGYISTLSLTSTVQAVPARFGNVLTVDQIYGNDATASIGGLPYLTVDAAVTAAAAGGGIYTIWIMPGTYNLSAGITIPTACSIRGKSVQTTVIQMTGVTSSTTLVTLSTQTRIEDVALILTSATASANLIGVYFPSGTTTTCKIRGCTITVTSTSTNSATVYGIFADGTTTNPTIQLSSNAVQRTTLNITSSSTGKIRGCYFTGALQFIIRDATIFATGTGSAIDVIGVECTNTGAYISIQTSTVCARPTSNPDTVHDIKQPPLSYFASPVIYLNATNLVNSDADANGFGVNTQANQLNFVVQGVSGNKLQEGSYYLLPGIETVDNLTKDPAGLYYSIPFVQKAIVFSASIQYVGTNFATPSQMYVNIRKASSPFVEGTIIATTTLSNTILGPVVLQNFASTYTPTSNYLQVQVSTTGGFTIGNQQSGALYVGLCTL